MMRRLLAIISVPALALLPVAAEAGEWANLSSDKKAGKMVAPASVQQGQPAPDDRPKLYTSKKWGFAIPVPPGAEVVEREGTNQISMRSRKGYVINLQVGPKRAQIPLARMSSLLEAQYLGDGKPWSARGAENPAKVAGLAAYDVMYSGAGTQARVLVARGPVNDYVFIFIAPERVYRKLVAEFDWAIKNFQPNPQDVIQRHTAVQQVSPANPAAAQANNQRFAEPGYGYAINYPASWQLSKPAAMAAMFSGREGSSDYAAIIGVQNIAPPGARNPGEAAKRAFNQLKASLGNAVQDLQVIDDQAWTYARSGIRLIGRQLVVTYRHAGEIFQKQMIVVPRPTGSVAHVWSYTAPRAQYASLQPTAESMLRSWTILTDRRQ